MTPGELRIYWKQVRNKAMFVSDEVEVLLKEIEEKDRHIIRLGGVLPGSGHRHSQEDCKCEDSHKP